MSLYQSEPLDLVGGAWLGLWFMKVLHFLLVALVLTQ